MGEDVELRHGDSGKDMESISMENILQGMNSHYLFDALHVIKGYMVVDGEKAMDTINCLAKAMRKSMRMLKEGKAFVTVSEELEYVRFYLELAQMHYGTVEYQMINNSEDFSVPMFTIRHMVEDAFVRCLTAEPAFRNLRVYTFSDNTHDYIEIKDSGKQLSDEEIDQMTASEPAIKRNEYLFYRDLGWRVEIKSLPGEGNRVFLSHARKQ